MDINDLAGYVATKFAIEGDSKLLKKRLEENQLLTRYERQFLKSFLEKSRRGNPGNKLRLSRLKQVANVHLTYRSLKEQQWPKDAAKQRVAEICGVSRSTVETMLREKPSFVQMLDAAKAQEKPNFFSEAKTPGTGSKIDAESASYFADVIGAACQYISDNKAEFGLRDDEQALKAIARLLRHVSAFDPQTNRE